MTAVLTVMMNDSAARLLEAASGSHGLRPSEDPAPRPRDCLEQGIIHRSDVLVWTGSVGNAANAPSFFPPANKINWRTTEDEVTVTHG